MAPGVWWSQARSSQAIHGRYGYRRVTALLRWEGWNVNHKRIESILDGIEELKKTTPRTISTTPVQQTQQGNNPDKLKWSPDQVLGGPDTLMNGDFPTAWATRTGNSGIL